MSHTLIYLSTFFGCNKDQLTKKWQLREMSQDQNFLRYRSLSFCSCTLLAALLVLSMLGTLILYKIRILLARQRRQWLFCQETITLICTYWAVHSHLIDFLWVPTYSIMISNLTFESYKGNFFLLSYLGNQSMHSKIGKIVELDTTRSGARYDGANL